MDKKILFVDDEVHILEMLKAVFDGMGYSIFTSGSAEEALRLVKKENIECIFTDLKMPGMDGIELCETLRDNNYFGFIYAITGYGKFYELQDCRKAGFDDYFLKPLKMDVIRQTAEAAFEKLERWHSRQINLTSTP